MHKCLEGLEGKSVCLVGNSCSLLNRSLGSIVDGHDIVIRFNVWSTYGQEIDVGMKTSVWAVSTSLASKWSGWTDHLKNTLTALNEIWSFQDGYFDFTKMQEFWFVPNLTHPTSTMNLDDDNIPREIKCKMCHHGPYIREIDDNKPRADLMLTCGLRVLALLVAHRDKLSDLTVIGFGERDPKKRVEQVDHYFYETFEKPMEKVTDVYSERYGYDKWCNVHDLNYEHKVLNNWIDQGLFRRLEDESDYTV